MDTILAFHGMKTKILQMTRPIGIEGGSSQSQQAAEAFEVPGTVADASGFRRAINYQAPVIPNSDLPALWGRKFFWQEIGRSWTWSTIRSTFVEKDKFSSDHLLAA